MEESDLSPARPSGSLPDGPRLRHAGSPMKPHWGSWTVWLPFFSPDRRDPESPWQAWCGPASLPQRPAEGQPRRNARRLPSRGSGALRGSGKRKPWGKISQDSSMLFPYRPSGRNSAMTVASRNSQLRPLSLRRASRSPCGAENRGSNAAASLVRRSGSRANHPKRRRENNQTMP